MKRATVLIVDDHTLIRDSWALLFSRHDRFQVLEHTGDGKHAIELATKYRPDIVLLDINMGPMHGFEVLKMIRNYSPSSKVIAVSLHLQPVYAKRMINNGAKGYVSKNSSAEELLKAVDEVLAGRTYVSDDIKNLITGQWADNKDSGMTVADLLSPRELEIVKLIRHGLSSKMIGEQLHIGAKTVEVHRHNILKKLKVKNTAALIDFINVHGLD
jgi:two-component system invasion response regulator UvrY